MASSKLPDRRPESLFWEPLRLGLLESLREGPPLEFIETESSEDSLQSEMSSNANFSSVKLLVLILFYTGLGYPTVVVV